MSSATSTAATMQRNAATPAMHPTRPAQSEAARTLRFGSEEAAVLKLDLSDLPIPRLDGLQVDGLKPTLMQRLFGRK